MPHSAVAKVGMGYIMCKGTNQNERVRSKREQNILKHQTHEQSYIEDGNIRCGLFLQLEKMFNREKKFYRKDFQKNIRNFGEKN